MAIGKETETESAKGRISTQEIIRRVFVAVLCLGLIALFVVMFIRGR